MTNAGSTWAPHTALSGRSLTSKPIAEGEWDVFVLRRKEGNYSVLADGWELKPSAQQQRLESGLRRAKDMIAEITAENVALKKGLSD